MTGSVMTFKDQSYVQLSYSYIYLFSYLVIFENTVYCEILTACDISII